MRFAAIALGLAALIAGCGGSSGAGQGDKEKAIAAAKFIYAGKAKENLSAGPCLSEGIPGLSDWVVDIAHDPRQAVDDQPANQCQSFRDGETHHFFKNGQSGMMSVTDVYAAVQAIGSSDPGTLLELSFFSHAWHGGPLPR